MLQISIVVFFFKSFFEAKALYVTENDGKQSSSDYSDKVEVTNGSGWETHYVILCQQVSIPHAFRGEKGTAM